MRHYFNPLSLYRERLFGERHRKRVERFQSTLPIQGETAQAAKDARHEPISIHSPYTGRDDIKTSNASLKKIFQSTLPIQGETFFPSSGIQALVISIHSPYTGRDMWDNRGMTVDRAFQSTLPIQGETDIIYIPKSC